MSIRTKHIAATRTIRTQAKVHGYSLTDAEAADIAAQVVMVLAAIDVGDLALGDIEEQSEVAA